MAREMFTTTATTTGLLIAAIARLTVSLLEIVEYLYNKATRNAGETSGVHTYAAQLYIS